MTNFYDASTDNYQEFEKYTNQALAGVIASGQKIFTTNVRGLFDTFLANLPHQARQYYTCNACRKFFELYGSLVTIGSNGEIHNIFWDVNTAPQFFKKTALAMTQQIKSAKVTGVFVTSEKTLGKKKDGAWTHFYADVPESFRFKSATQKAHEKAAELNVDFLTLTSAFQKFSIDAVIKSSELILSDSLYRGDKVKGVAQWFLDLYRSMETASDSRIKQNLRWKAVASAPTGFARIPNSQYGTLLSDIEAGHSTESITKRFERKMREYQVSQVDPTANQVEQAEKLILDLGLEKSIDRRYVQFEEIPSFMWLANEAKDGVKAKEETSSLFGNLKTKDAEPKKPATIELPSKVMTWSKFKRTVLPLAESIEARMDNPNRFMALVTALNSDAPNIMQWDNPFSWYYAGGGIDGEMKRRVEEAGGKHEDNEIRATLMWEGYTDLDLHCINPNGYHIYYHRASRKDRHGGELDIDMNGLDRSSNTPVENIRWSRNAPEGRYKFYVHNYNEKTNGHKGTPFKLELEVNGEVYSHEGNPLVEGGKVTVFEFEYKKGQPVKFITGGGVSKSSFTARPNGFVKVNGITNSPNLWDGEDFTHVGNHIFFILDGVKDNGEGIGRGFLPEMLKSELHPIRRTLNAYTSTTPIHGADEATACGIGFSVDSEWNLVLKVKTHGSTQLITIDRLD